MSWLHNLSETYDACFGSPRFTGTDALTPIDHIMQPAHIEIVLDQNGNFDRAVVVPKENTLLPVSEKSAGRTSASAAHPLCDKLRYVAADFGSPKVYQLYLKQLRTWSRAIDNRKLQSILHYVEQGKVVEDLVRFGVLTRQPDGTLETQWKDGLSPLAKLLTPNAKTKERDQGNALIRWRVEIPGEPVSAVWEDVALQKAWADHYATLPTTRGLCFASGTVEALAFNHPKRLRSGRDGAKLISTNDKTGYTFRGRFHTAAEAYGLSSDATQKAHNALRWLIRRQGTWAADQVIVSWEAQAQPTPPVVASTWDLFEEGESGPVETISIPVVIGNAEQTFALRLRQKILGYQAKLSAHSKIMVMALDSATPGRMAIPYYRELSGSEFLQRIEDWHNALAWPQNFSRNRQFIGTPAPRDIAEAAYGRRVDEKLLKATIERLLPCILDGSPLPRGLMLSAVARASNRESLEPWEFETVLGVACSLICGNRKDKDYRMALEEDRSSRSYLFGRLLAVAEKIESHTLYLAGEDRDTKAERLMQRFADHPAETWRTLELALQPYMQRLQNRRPATLEYYKQLLDTISTKFANDDFTLSGRLDPEFLLGYHCQRAALRRATASSYESSGTEIPSAE